MVKLSPQQQRKMIYKLTKHKRDNFSGHKNYSNVSVNIGCEVGRRGKPVTGMTDAESKKLEKELFLQPGELSENSPYWNDFFIPFPLNGTTFDDENSTDRLFLFVLKSMKKVAFGKDELKKKPKAEYLLLTNQKDEQEEDDKLSVKEAAYGNLSDATPQELRHIYAVLMKQKKNGVVVDVTSMTDKAIKNGLRQVIEVAPELFNVVAQDDKLALKAKIIELVSKKIISVTNTGYFRGKDQIAYDIDSMVQFMEDAHSQGMVIQFENELKAKK